MRILFNVVGSNLGNNGGSATIVKSTNALIDLGHEIYVLVDGANSYTWSKLKADLIVTRDPRDIPKADAIISTSFKSVGFADRCDIKNKYHWIRGWETWATDEKNLVNILKHSTAKKIVNSIGLQNKLNSFNIDSTIIYPGYDFNEIYPLGIRKDEEIILGGLYNSGPKRKSKRTDWIFKCYNKLKEKYPLKLFMFGTDGIPSSDVDYFIRNPNIEEKNRIYNTVNIWLAPSELEGLHLPPAEAMMTGCLVVGNSSPLSGTSDYLTDGVTGLVSENNIKSFITYVEVAVRHKELRRVSGNIGREKILSIGSREKNMKNLIELIKG